MFSIVVIVRLPLTKKLHQFNKPLSFLTNSEKKDFVKLGILQALISFLDVFGILLVGLSGSVAVSKITGQKMPEIFINFFIFNNLSTYSDYSKLLILLAVSILLLMAKTLFSLFIIYKLNIKLSEVTIRISDDAISKISKSSILWLNRIDPSKIIYTLGEGINFDYKNYLLGYFFITSELIFIIVITSLMFFTNPILTFTIYFIFFIAYNICSI